MGQVLLVGLGSSGDVNPMLGLGRALLSRGHAVTFLSAPPFEDQARAVGVDFAPLGTAEGYARVYADPDLWHPLRGLRVFFGYVAGLTGDTARAIEARFEPGRTVVVAAFQCFGSRVAQEQLGVPVCTVLPNPILLQSVHDPNRNPLGNPPRWLGRAGVRLVYRLTNLEVSRHARPPVEAARKVRGLAPRISDFARWAYSPELVLGLWPEFFAPPQPDWPRQARTTGFVPYDGPAEEGWRPPPDLEDRNDWLVFTPGSQMTHGEDFFRVACEAASRLGVPTLVVAKERSALPPDLPEGVSYLPYAPFAWLFERAAAVVHHGGVGTVGRALAAGTPQLIVPSGFDQFDNARRVVRHGLGAELPRKGLTATRLVEALRALMESEDVARACTRIREELRGTDPVGASCSAIEGLLGRGGGRT